MADRTPEIRITTPERGGYVAWIDGHPVVAKSSRAEIADWIEQEYGSPDELAREEADVRAAGELSAMLTNGDLDALPRVLRERTTPRHGMRLFKIFNGGRS